jgi:hypothetical protein
MILGNKDDIELLVGWENCQCAMVFWFHMIILMAYLDLCRDILSYIPIFRGLLTTT